MTEIGEVSVRKRRSRQEIKRLVTEFETSGLRRKEFCDKHNLTLGTLQRGLRTRRMEVEGQSEGKRLVEVKMAGIQRHGSGPGTCSLEVVLAGGRRIEVRQDFDAETLARLIQLIEQVLNRLRGDRHLIRSYDCEPVGLDDLLAGSRVVFVFASVTTENQGFLGEREFASRLRSMPAGTR